MTDTSNAPVPGRWATILVFVIASLLIAAWLPDYLRWPWWPDLDAWATIAQGWDAGILPYRDVEIFNFPGQIEISWILGKLVGWGKTWPFYALDAALLLGLGALMAVWSRRRFGRVLPGLLGWLAALSTYMNLDYAFVAQRDWQGPLLAVSCVLVLQTWPGRAGLACSSALMASAFAIRPHVVLWIPVVVATMILDGDASRSSKIRRVGLWGLLFAAIVSVWFGPLIAQGLIGDLIAGVRQASYGSGYGKATLSSVFQGVLRQASLVDFALGFTSIEKTYETLRGWRVLATLVGLAILSIRGRWRLAIPWGMTLAVALLYEPLHPKRHAYLALPLQLVEAVAFGVLAGLILDRLAKRSKIAAIVFLVLLVLAVPGVPTYCRPLASFDAMMGREPILVPQTAAPHFFPGERNTPYRWNDYRDTVAYLRAKTNPDTRVMNFLRNVPFPSINGVVGRVTLWPAESGVIWLWSVNPKREERFVAALAKSPEGSVVVWSPGERIFDPKLKLEGIENTVRRGFHFEKRFGPMEVWRKNVVEIPKKGD